MLDNGKATEIIQMIHKRQKNKVSGSKGGENRTPVFRIARTPGGHRRLAIIASDNEGTVT
jgi:hypothetical protein